MNAALIPAVIAAATLLAIVVLTLAGLKAWHEWLDLQRLTVDRRRAPVENASGARIEIADLKERVRKLEAIASGVDL